MITINDVARHCGVSIATVSNVINRNGKVKKSTEEKVLQAIEELHYIPNSIAKGLKTRTSRTIGILTEDICTRLTAGMINGIGHYCEQQGYHTQLCNLNIRDQIEFTLDFRYEDLQMTEPFQRALRENLNILRSAQIGGLIYIGAHTREIGGALPKLDFPVTVLYCNSARDCSVCNDDYQGASAVMEYLLGQGHRRIAVITGPFTSPPSQDRLRAYREVLARRGIAVREDYIAPCTWMYEDALPEVERLLALDEPPTAIFAMNDGMACAALNYARSHGLDVPSDLSVVGYDDSEISYYTAPPLTTVRIPFFEMGEQAAALTIAQIEGAGDKDAVRHFLLPSTLVIRDTVAAPVKTNE